MDHVPEKTETGPKMVMVTWQRDGHMIQFKVFFTVTQHGTQQLQRGGARPGHWTRLTRSWARVRGRGRWREVSTISPSHQVSPQLGAAHGQLGHCQQVQPEAVRVTET